MTRRLAWCALALAAACGAEPRPQPTPLDTIRLPVGIAVHHGRVLVASSNADLFYEEATGGSVLALSPDPANVASVSVTGSVRVHSFAGELAVARTEAPAAGVPDAEACGTLIPAPLALFGTRGSNTINAVAIGPAGTLSCDAPGRCGLVAAGGFGDPFGLTVACGGGRARAFFGYLRAQNAEAYLAELDLTDFTLRTTLIGVGPVRGFAYDRDRDRLLMTGLATATATPLRWIDLGGCTLGADPRAGGCTGGAAVLPIVGGSYGLELRSIALAHPAIPGVPRGPAEPVRAYATARLYDLAAAASAGFRNTDFAGVLLVLDLFDDARGGVDPQIVSVIDLPSGAQGVQVLPRASGWAAGRRDVVAVLSVNEGALTIYDDETGALQLFRTDAISTPGHPATGAPVLGNEPYGLAVDPVASGATARVWVGAYRDGFVTPIDVTLEPEVVATFAGGRQLRISGATP